jgi:hypothetical protein
LVENAGVVTGPLACTETWVSTAKPVGGGNTVLDTVTDTAVAVV